MARNRPGAEFPAQASPADHGGKATDVDREPGRERVQPLGCEVVRNSVGGKNHRPAPARRLGHDPPVVDSVWCSQRDRLVPEGVRASSSEGRHAPAGPAEDGESVAKAREQKAAIGFAQREEAGARALCRHARRQFETPEDLHQADKMGRIGPISRGRASRPEARCPPQRPACGPRTSIGRGPGAHPVTHTDQMTEGAAGTGPGVLIRPPLPQVARAPNGRPECVYQLGHPQKSP